MKAPTRRNSMPIVTHTFEEKVAVLKQDTRDYIERVQMDFEEWSAHRVGAIQYADIVRFLETTVQGSFSAENVINGSSKFSSNGPGPELLHEASIAYDAQQLLKRWRELPSRGQNGPELDTWER